MKGCCQRYSQAGDAYSLSSGATQEAAESLGTTVSFSGEPFLAADVGGTHARIGLMAFRPGQSAPVVLAYHVYKCAEYAGLETIVRTFCDEYAIKPSRLALACAGFLHEGRVVNSNLQWPIVPTALEAMMGLSDIKVLNDFEALAYGTIYLDADSVTPLHDPRRDEETATGSVVIVGPGTGLGVAVRLPGAQPKVLATEAGHIQLAARVGREQQVLAELTQVDTHVPYDAVLSGPGLLRLYGALCRIEQLPVVFDQPAAITAAACAGTNAMAVETLQLFCGWLGSFLGDLAMLYGATGGIYLAGGFLSRMTAFVEKSTFTSRFLDKGVMRPFLQTIPVHVVDHAQLGVIGAACWLMSRETEGKTA
jgi:glucokinase